LALPATTVVYVVVYQLSTTPSPAIVAPLFISICMGRNLLLLKTHLDAQRTGQQFAHQSDKITSTAAFRK
jgi:hypothetical protein